MSWFSPSAELVQDKENPCSSAGPLPKTESGGQTGAAIEARAREAPNEKERAVRERSRRTPRQVAIGRETERPQLPDHDHGKGRKKHAHMVLVYEGEEDGVTLPDRYY